MFFAILKTQAPSYREQVPLLILKQWKSSKSKSQRMSRFSNSSQGFQFCILREMIKVLGPSSYPTPRIPPQPQPVNGQDSSHGVSTLVLSPNKTEETAGFSSHNTQTVSTQTQPTSSQHTCVIRFTTAQDFSERKPSPDFISKSQASPCLKQGLSQNRQNGS